MTEAETPAGHEGEKWLSTRVLGVGAASLFSDAGHELATSVLPTFLTSTLHAGPAALGAIPTAAFLYAAAWMALSVGSVLLDQI